MGKGRTPLPFAHLVGCQSCAERACRVCRLVFEKKSIRGGGKAQGRANIVAAKGTVEWAAIYRGNADATQELVRYEGVNSGIT